MKKVLIAEDDKFLGGAYRAKLQKAGFEVRIATDGVDGLAALDSFNPDIVLMDLLMPKMDGFEMLRQLRAKPGYEKIPVIIASNLGQKEDIDRGMSLGATDYIIKSNIQLHEIVDKIAKLLG